MSDEQMQSVLDGWFEDTDPAPPNPQRTAARVMARVPQTRQRGRWLPFRLFRPKAQAPTATDTAEHQPSPIPATNGHTPTVQGRTQSMFSPVKAITAGALVFALGGVLLIAQPFDQQQGSVPEVETDAEAEPAGAVTFEGQWGCDEGISPLAAFEHGDVASLSLSVALPVLKMDDPRLDGVTTWTAIRSIWGPDAEGPVVDGVPLFGELVTNTTTVRIATDEGAWQGGFIDAGNLGEEGLRGPLVLVGEGDYEGFSVIMDPQFSGIENSECGGWNVQGFIVEGGMPPAPDAATALPVAE